MRIISSAIKFYLKDSEYPIILCGKRHCNIFKIAHNLNLDYNKNQCVQGFFTDDNSFVGRYEAFWIAKETNQLLPEAQEKYKNKSIAALYSEDLW